MSSTKSFPSGINPTSNFIHVNKQNILYLKTNDTPGFADIFATTDCAL